jgi:ABC-type multidrug transport system ATPase subunit
MNSVFSVGYTNDNVLINDVNLDLSAGIVSIFGKNGSGKSSLAKTLCGELSPLKGKVKFTERAKIGVISDYYSLPDELFVKDLSILIDANHTSVHPEIDVVFRSLSNKKISTLSSGEKKIAELWLLLCYGKDIIVLDEAFANLDAVNKKMCMDFIQKLVHKNVSFLHISHNYYDILQLGERIYYIDQVKKRLIKYDGEMSVAGIIERLES